MPDRTDEFKKNIDSLIKELAELHAQRPVDGIGRFALNAMITAKEQELANLQKAQEALSEQPAAERSPVQFSTRTSRTSTTPTTNTTRSESSDLEKSSSVDAAQPLSPARSASLVDAGQPLPQVSPPSASMVSRLRSTVQVASRDGYSAQQSPRSEQFQAFVLPALDGASADAAKAQAEAASKGRAEEMAQAQSRERQRTIEAAEKLRELQAARINEQAVKEARRFNSERVAIEAQTRASDPVPKQALNAVRAPILSEADKLAREEAFRIAAKGVAIGARELIHSPASPQARQYIQAKREEIQSALNKPIEIAHRRQIAGMEASYHNAPLAESPKSSSSKSSQGNDDAKDSATKAITALADALPALTGRAAVVGGQQAATARKDELGELGEKPSSPRRGPSK